MIYLITEDKDRIALAEKMLNLPKDKKYKVRIDEYPEEQPIAMGKEFPQEDKE